MENSRPTPLSVWYHPRNTITPTYNFLADKIKRSVYNTLFCSAHNSENNVTPPPPRARPAEYLPNKGTIYNLVKRCGDYLQESRDRAPVVFGKPRENDCRKVTLPDSHEEPVQRNYDDTYEMRSRPQMSAMENKWKTYARDDGYCKDEKMKPDKPIEEMIHRKHENTDLMMNMPEMRTMGKRWKTHPRDYVDFKDENIGETKLNENIIDMKDGMEIERPCLCDRVNKANGFERRMNDKYRRINDKYEMMNDKNGRINDKYEMMNDKNGRINDKYGRMNDKNGRINDKYGGMNDKNGRINDKYGRMNDKYGRINDNSENCEEKVCKRHPRNKQTNLIGERKNERKSKRKTKRKGCKQIYELSENQCRNFKETGYVRVNVKIKPNVCVSDFDIIIRKEKMKSSATQ